MPSHGQAVYHDQDSVMDVASEEVENDINNEESVHDDSNPEERRPCSEAFLKGEGEGELDGGVEDGDNGEVVPAGAKDAVRVDDAAYSTRKLSVAFS